MNSLAHLACVCALITALAYQPVAHAETLSMRYLGDSGIAEASSVLLHEDFENGWRNWDYPGKDTERLFIEKQGNRSHSGAAYLRSTVSLDDLRWRRYLPNVASHKLETPVDEIFWRIYVKFEGVAPKPHHWIRLNATDGNFDVRGKAGIRPAGDEAFWMALDISNRNVPFYYLYWHNMRSGRCNDGIAREGCDGDQGKTYYFGNHLISETKQRLPSDRWLCIEIHARANTPGKHDGETALYIDGERQMQYTAGSPAGTWLRDKFHPGGCDYDACTSQAPFEGLDLRTDDKVKFRKIVIDSYNELGTFKRKLNYLKKHHEDVSEVQTIYYDDMVVATERIGCMVKTEHPTTEQAISVE